MSSDEFTAKLLMFVEQAKAAETRQWDISDAEYDKLFALMDELDDYIGNRYVESPALADDE